MRCFLANVCMPALLKVAFVNFSIERIYDDDESRYWGKWEKWEEGGYT